MFSALQDVYKAFENLNNPPANFTTQRKIFLKAYRHFIEIETLRKISPHLLDSLRVWPRHLMPTYNDTYLLYRYEFYYLFG